MRNEHLYGFVGLETIAGLCTPKWIETSKATLSDSPNLKEEIWRKKTTGLLRDLFLSLNKNLKINSFIEIGAHEASISIDLKKIGMRDIYAYEANPYVYEKYKSKLKNLNINYANFAISEKAGIVQISIPRFSKDLARPDTSLLKRSAEAEYEELDVESKTLKSVIKEKKLQNISLWIDTEGLTLNVLKSAGKYLENVNLIHAEVEDINYWKNQSNVVEVFEFCYERDFIAIARDMDGRGQYNVIFVRNCEINKVGGLISDYFKDLNGLQYSSDNSMKRLNRFFLK